MTICDSCRNMYMFINVCYMLLELLYVSSKRLQTFNEKVFSFLSQVPDSTLSESLAVVDKTAVKNVCVLDNVLGICCQSEIKIIFKIFK